MKIAVIGAGLAGVSFAAGAVQRGHAVTVFEKSRGTSGRLATRRTEHGSFDHGAPVIQAETQFFRLQCEDWRARGLLARIGPHYAAVPGMSSLVKALEKSSGAHFLFEHRAIRFDFDKSWTLGLATGADAAVSAGREVPQTLFAGFDALVLAVPAEQVAEFAHPFQARAAGVRSEPKIVLLFELDQAFSGTVPQGFVLYPESAKPRAAGHRYVLHASAAWSAAQLEVGVETLREQLLALLGVQPRFATAHKWRYSQVASPVPQDCFFSAPQRFGVCGDWFSVPSLSPQLSRAEHAWYAARALLEHF